MSIHNHSCMQHSKHSWQFAGLDAGVLVTQLVSALTTKAPDVQWRSCWLNNAGHPVIGLLPKVAWSVYPLPSAHDYSPKLQIIKTSRQSFTNVLSTDYHSNMTLWQQELIEYCQIMASAPSAIHARNASPNGAFYTHGLMGFIGYDITAQQLSPNPPDTIDQADQPCAYLGHYDITLKADQEGWRLWWSTETSLEIIDRLYHLLDQIDAELSAQSVESRRPLQKLLLDAVWSYQDYQCAFTQLQQHLSQGDCYQINLTQVWQAKLESQFSSTADIAALSSLLNYLPDLHTSTQAPFAGYLQLADFELLSCSPELFFSFEISKSDEWQICTKPIKGTRPRGRTAREDQSLKAELAESEKDRAENVMIVDLLRNDLGRFAKTGSVKVPQLFAIESFSNVHHMVSTITATLTKDCHPLTVLFESLPAGSITGTPKKRAVEIIAALEALPRGAYCGTMGYLNFDGSGQWNVLIRTLQANQSGQLSLWAGGGITVSSDCKAEYQECWDKVGNLLKILAQ